MKEALRYAKLSAETYSAKIDIGADSDAIAGVISFAENGLLIGFQGTDNAEGLMTDIKAIPHGAGPLGRVHHGILESVESVWPQLSLLTPNVLYGHSLGGAQALLVAASLCVEGKPPNAVYAFEPPKLSIDDKIKHILADNNVCVCIIHNGNDIVPMLPPGVIWPWRHPGEVTRIGCPHLPIPNLTDHLISRVIKSIKNHIKHQRTPECNFL